MRSGTSFFNWPVFKKTVARFWPLWAAYSVIWLLMLPLNGVMMLQMEALSRDGGSYMENFAYSIVPSAAQAGIYLALIFGVLAAMAVFSHLYNPRSANLFGSLPIRREGLFLTHYLAGLAFLLVPNAVVFLLTFLVELAGGSVCMQGLLFWLGAVCGECFLFYSMAVFCAMFTGHILALPAFYVILNFLAEGVTALFYGMLSIFYYGFFGLSDWLDDVVNWLTPVANLFDRVGCYGGYYHVTNYLNSTSSDVGPELTTYGLWVVGVYALAALALTAASFFLYRARRLESAGDVVAVRPMRPVFKYGVAVCAGLGLGFVTTFILGVGKSGLAVSTVIWGVVSCFAAQMLLDKSFKVFHKWKGAVGLTAAFLVLFAVVGFDLTGFETRVPNAADVKYVDVSGLYGIYLSDHGDQVDLEVDDPQVIELITAMHRAAVEQRDWDDWDWTDAPEDTYSTNLRLTYHLKNGSTLERRYNLVWLDPAQVNQEGTSAWIMEQLYNNRDFYWQVYGFDTLEAYLSQGWRLDRAEYAGFQPDTREDESYYEYDYEVENGFRLDFYGADARALLSAVEEDFQAGRTGVRHVGDQRSGPENSRVLRFYASNDDRDFYLSVCVQDTAERTLAVLDGLTAAE